MQKRTRNVAALGMLTVVATVLFFWGLYFLLGNPVLRGGSELTVLLDDGAGLKRGDRVQLRGVEVGSVQDVQLIAGDGVGAQIRLRGDIAVPRDSRAIVTGDVFGAHTLLLVPGTATAMVEDGDTVRGMVSKALPELASALGERAQIVLDAAGSLLSPGMVADVHSTTAELAPSARELRASLLEVRRAANAMRLTVEEIQSAGTGTAATATMTQIQTSAQALTSAANALERSIGTFETLIGQIDPNRGTLGLMLNDSSLYRNLSVTVRELGLLATDIRERPQRYINVHIF
jgi:phospholipid/cholesterol/gamma-HCH transport system substrate-binding protein